MTQEFILIEELKSVGGTSGTIVDAKTNEPIANYKKGSWGYEASWHPDFLEVHPDIAKSERATDIVHHPRNRNDKVDSKQSIVYHVQRVHRRLAENGFKDNLEVLHGKTDEGGDKKTYFHGGKPVLVVAPKSGQYDPQYSLHPDFVKETGIPDDVANKYANEIKLSAGSSKSDMHDKIESVIADASKKKTAVGTKAFGDAKTKMYHIITSPEEASTAHENELKSTGHAVTRLSPSHFIAQKGDEMVHSIAHGDQLHAVHTIVSGYGAKNLTNPHSF